MSLIINLKVYFGNLALKHDKYVVAEKEFHEQFDKLLTVLGITSPFFLVVQV